MNLTGLVGVLAVLLLLGLVLIIWNVRLAKRASAAEKLAEVLRASQELQRRAEKVRNRKRSTGTDLLDKLQNRDRSTDSS